MGAAASEGMVEILLLFHLEPTYLCLMDEAADSMPVTTKTPAIKPPMMMVRAASSHSFVLLRKFLLRVFGLCTANFIEAPSGTTTATGRSWPE